MGLYLILPFFTTNIPFRWDSERIAQVEKNEALKKKLKKQKAI